MSSQDLQNQEQLADLTKQPFVPSVLEDKLLEGREYGKDLLSGGGSLLAGESAGRLLRTINKSSKLFQKLGLREDEIKTISDAIKTRDWGTVNGVLQKKVLQSTKDGISRVANPSRLQEHVSNALKDVDYDQQLGDSRSLLNEFRGLGKDDNRSFAKFFNDKTKTFFMDKKEAALEAQAQAKGGLSNLKGDFKPSDLKFNKGGDLTIKPDEAPSLKPADLTSQDLRFNSSGIDSKQPSFLRPLNESDDDFFKRVSKAQKKAERRDALRYKEDDFVNPFEQARPIGKTKFRGHPFDQFESRKLKEPVELDASTNKPIESAGDFKGPDFDDLKVGKPELFESYDRQFQLLQDRAEGYGRTFANTPARLTKVNVKPSKDLSYKTEPKPAVEAQPDEAVNDIKQLQKNPRDFAPDIKVDESQVYTRGQNIKIRNEKKATSEQVEGLNRDPVPLEAKPVKAQPIKILDASTKPEATFDSVEYNKALKNFQSLNPKQRKLARQRVQEQRIDKNDFEGQNKIVDDIRSKSSIKRDKQAEQAITDRYNGLSADEQALYDNKNKELNIDRFDYQSKNDILDNIESSRQPQLTTTIKPDITQTEPITSTPKVNEPINNEVTKSDITKSDIGDTIEQGIKDATKISEIADDTLGGDLITGGLGLLGLIGGALIKTHHIGFVKPPQPVQTSYQYTAGIE